MTRFFEMLSRALADRTVIRVFKDEFSVDMFDWVPAKARTGCVCAAALKVYRLHLPLFV